VKINRRHFLAVLTGASLPLVRMRRAVLRRPNEGTAAAERPSGKNGYGRASCPMVRSYAHPMKMEAISTPATAVLRSLILTSCWA
jgi:hypothetical protein